MSGTGKLVQVDPEEVAVGDMIVIKAGEKIPLDGVVLEGSSAVDTAALTGESLPRDVDAGRRCGQRLHQSERPAARCG